MLESNPMYKPKVLAVDDEEFNLDIIQEYLTDAGFDVITAIDGWNALKNIAAHDDIAVIVLDRMMPVMSGIDILKNIKANPRYKDIPVVMQTAAAEKEQIQEGIDLGVYYYLAKPYKEELLVSIVKSAYAEALNIQAMKDENTLSSDLSSLFKGGTFRFKNLPQSNSLAAFLAQGFPDMERAFSCISVLLDNAIFGNLGISDQEQTELLVAGKLQETVAQKLKQEPFKHKYAKAYVEKTPECLVLRITDQGKGFDWEKHLQITAEKTAVTNVIGLARAKSFFTTIEYTQNGSEVTCTKLINCA